jgi:predicted double-glycine peptidase
MRSLILQVVALLILADACAQSANDAPGSEALTALLPGVPDTRQSTEYSCGAAALQAVLSYWGRDVGEEDLRELLNTDPESGTYPEDILRVAQELGFEAEYRENLTLDEVEASVIQGVPVIVDCQAWRSPASGNASWSEDWVDGHWMVIIGLDDENVYFEDPYILGSRGFMSRQEFEERWHNPRGWDESDTVNQIHLGIFIRGENSTTIRPFRHVD